MYPLRRILTSLLLGTLVLWHHTYLPVHLACHAHYGSALDLDHEFEQGHGQEQVAGVSTHPDDHHDEAEDDHEEGHHDDHDGHHKPHPAHDHLSGYFSCQAVHLDYTVIWRLSYCPAPAPPAELISLPANAATARGPPANPPRLTV